MIIEMILNFCVMFVPAFLIYKFFSFVNKKYKLDNKPYEFSVAEEIGQESIVEQIRGGAKFMSPRGDYTTNYDYLRWDDGFLDFQEK